MYNCSKFQQTSQCLYQKTVIFWENEIGKHIRNLDPSKAHGHGMLSIRMLKTCVDFVCGTLELIFQFCYENGKFLSEWEKKMLFLYIRK